jgi:hypothetical protein
MHSSIHKVLPPKGAKVWSLVSPETPQNIKRILQFAQDPITNTIYISNLGDTVLSLSIHHTEHLGSPVSGKSSLSLREMNSSTPATSIHDVTLYPVEQSGSYVTSSDFARKIWENLVNAGYKTV